MKFSIRHQDSYSRGELLLRSFFGFIYMAIPHYICLMFLGLAAGLMTFVAFFAILITGKFPKGMFDFVVNVNRWGMRLVARMMNLSDGYPAFGLDVKDSNVVFEVPYTGSSNRLTVLLRVLIGPILLIPHIICLMFLQLGMMICMLLAWFIVLFTGKYPKGMHDFAVGTMRWGVRVGLYMNFLTDTYPPFSMAETNPVNWDNEKKIEDHLV